MGKTEISWCDETWNPTRGCSRISEGCRNCYAEEQAARIVRMGKGKATPYDGLVQVVNGEARWTGAVAFDAKRLAEPLHRRKPCRFFVDSMSDLFHDGFSNEQIAAVFGVMAACPQHVFMVLTKRPQRMREWFEWVEKRGDDGKSLFPGDDREWRIWQMLNVAARRAGAEMPSHHGGAWPLPNVMIGVSVENQAAADERIPLLLQTPAAVRFLSLEPLLGPVRLHEWLGREHGLAQIGAPRGISLAIAGCESGSGARPCEVEWLRSLRDQCKTAGVAFWLKQAKPQLGASTLITTKEQAESRVQGKLMGTIPIVGFGPGSVRKQGGIIELPYLDGVQWTQLPEVKS